MNLGANRACGAQKPGLHDIIAAAADVSRRRAQANETNFQHRRRLPEGAGRLFFESAFSPNRNATMISLGVIIILSALSWSRYGAAIARYLTMHRQPIKRSCRIISTSSVALLFLPRAHVITGEIAIAILWIILFIPVLADVLHLEIFGALKLFRRELGILMGVLAIVHFGQYFSTDKSVPVWSRSFWVSDGSVTIMAMGFAALLVSTALLVTSNSFSTVLLGKGWKRLHRMVYLLLLLAALHGEMAKRLHVGMAISSDATAGQGGPDTFGFPVAGIAPLSLLLIGKLLQRRALSNSPSDR